MNEESQDPMIDPELEARIAALVMGEASELEREQLDRLMADHPELRSVKEHFESVHGLLTEIGKGEFPGDGGAWILPAEKRNAILDLLASDAEDGPVFDPVVNPVVTIPTFLSNNRYATPFWSLSRIAAVIGGAGFIGLMVLAISITNRQSGFNDRASSALLFDSEGMEFERALSLAESSDFSPGDAGPKESFNELAKVFRRQFGQDVGQMKANHGASKRRLASESSLPEYEIESSDNDLSGSLSGEAGAIDFKGGTELTYEPQSEPGLGFQDTPESPRSLDSATMGRSKGRFDIAANDGVKDRFQPPAKTRDAWFAGGEPAGSDGDSNVNRFGLNSAPASAAAEVTIPEGGSILLGGIRRDAESAKKAEVAPESWDKQAAPESPARRATRAQLGASTTTSPLDSGGTSNAGFGSASVGGPAGMGMGGGGMGGMNAGTGGYGDANSNSSGYAGRMFGGMGSGIAMDDQANGSNEALDFSQGSGRLSGGYVAPEHFGVDPARPTLEPQPLAPMAVTQRGAIPAFVQEPGEGTRLFAMPNAPTSQRESNTMMVTPRIIINEDEEVPAIDGIVEAKNAPFETEKAELDSPATDSETLEENVVDYFMDVDRSAISPDANLNLYFGPERNWSELAAGQEAAGQKIVTTEDLLALLDGEKRKSVEMQVAENDAFAVELGTITNFGVFGGLAEKQRDAPLELPISGKVDAKSRALSRQAAIPAGLDEKNATDEAFSTFSLHVSDVSFKLAQAALARGEWPEASKVRIEEFVNAFDYGDPLPSGGEHVSCRLEQSSHPFLQQRNVMRVAMRTAATGRASSTPLRLTLLLDNSGSMERIDRQQTVRRAFALLAAQLQPNDQVTLISFARQPRLLADKVSGADAGQLVTLLDNLPSEGGTNIEAALQLAFEKATEQQTEGAQNRIILLTDGAVNLGDANPESLSGLVTTIRDAGIAFDAAGISAEGLNDEVLEALTRKGDGRYYLLDSLDDADDRFVRQIAGALRPSAKNVKVQIEFNPKRVGRYKLLGFEKHLLEQEDFRNDQVDAAEMAAAEAGVAVYQYEAKPNGEGDIGSVSVRFRDLATGQMIENRWPIPYQADAPRPDQADPSLRIATSAALFAAKLRGEPLGELVDMKALADLLASLPDKERLADRVQVLQAMIQQARQLSGN